MADAEKNFLYDLSYIYFTNFLTLIMTSLFSHSSKFSCGMFNYRVDVLR